ncbi:CBS domain-containing protein [Streptosporangium sp. KLBMP 9127]|nr:CBS domain-containing protein [Streptosporangium sp. KLBMP 9127]
MSGVAVAVQPEATFTELVTAMRRLDVGAVTVVDANRRPVGMVSEDDLLLRETDPYLHEEDLFEGHRLHREHLRARGNTARELMSVPAITVTPGTTVREAARLMHDNLIKQVPVVELMTGLLVGTICQRDLLKIFNRPATDIRRQIDELLQRLYIDADELTVTVRDCVVTLGGRLPRRSQGSRLVEAIRGVDGVIDVQTELTFATEDIGMAHRS